MQWCPADKTTESQKEISRVGDNACTITTTTTILTEVKVRSQNFIASYIQKWPSDKKNVSCIRIWLTSSLLQRNDIYGDQAVWRGYYLEQKKKDELLNAI